MLPRCFAVWTAGAAAVLAATSCASNATTAPMPRPITQQVSIGGLQPAAPTRIFVIAAGGISVFAATANGNATPLARIAGGLTLLSDPNDVVVASGKIITADNFDSGHAQLDNNQRILKFAAAANGNVAPANVLQCTKAPNFIVSPEGIDVDSAGNLYATIAEPDRPFEFGNSAIVRFPSPANSCAAGKVLLAGSNTMLNEPAAVRIGPLGSIYVANARGNSITVYGANAQGNAAPQRVIAGTSTQLSEPRRLAVDASGNIYVANVGTNSITVYSPNANGNVVPVRTVTSGVFGPLGVAVDANGRIYVANCSGGTVTAYAPGSATPDQTIQIQGYYTCPQGIAVK